MIVSEKLNPSAHDHPIVSKKSEKIMKAFTKDYQPQHVRGIQIIVDVEWWVLVEVCSTYVGPTKVQIETKNETG